MSPSRCNARQAAAFSPDSREGLPTGRYGRAESLPHLFRADCTAPSSKKRENGSPPPAGIPASSVYVSYPELSSLAASRTCRCSRHIPACATHRGGMPWETPGTAMGYQRNGGEGEWGDVCRLPSGTDYASTQVSAEGRINDLRNTVAAGR